MNDASRVLQKYLHQRGLSLDPAYVPQAAGVLVQALMEAEVQHITDAERYERSHARRVYRNGYRESLWQTAWGDILLKIPKLRRGTYYPQFLDSAETLIQELVLDAYTRGIDRQQLADQLRTLAMEPLQLSELADMSERLEDVVRSFREAPLENHMTGLYLDIVDFMQGSRARSLLVAIGIDEAGEYRLLAHDIVINADDEAWLKLLRGLQARGLRHLEHVVSAQDYGVRMAVQTVFPDALWTHESHFLLRERIAQHNASVLVDAISNLRLAENNADDDIWSQPRMQLDIYGSMVSEAFNWRMVA